MRNEEILEIIIFHHERLDGTGYPRGLKEDEIHPLSKILTICDCFDAMGTRLYHERRSMSYIYNEFISNEGRQFDKDFVEQFIQYTNNGIYHKTI